jgi:ribonuclease R
MKLATRIVTGLAVLGLAAPVLAAEATPAKQPAPVAQTQKHRHARKVAQTTEKKAEPKAEKKEQAPAKAEKAPAKAEKAPAKTEQAPAKAEKAPAQPSK